MINNNNGNDRRPNYDKNNRNGSFNKKSDSKPQFSKYSKKNDSKPQFAKSGKSFDSKPQFAKPAKNFDNKPQPAKKPPVKRPEPEEAQINEGCVIGRNAVHELLRGEREVDKLLVQKGEREGSITMIVAEAIARGIPVIETERGKLDMLSGGAPHQGVVAMAAEKDYCSVEDILEIAKERGEKPLIVISDGICDPYNLGAVIRCAEGAGAHGLIIPKRRNSGLTPVVTKASAGAIEHLAIAKVANIAATLDKLKELGVWTFAAEAGGTDYTSLDFDVPAAIVLGSEGEGVSELVRKRCDFVASIPMYGKVNSLNVSTAAAVLLYAAVKAQRK